LITGYQVLIDDGLDGAFSVGYDGSTNPSRVNTVISGLTSRTTYRLKVIAQNKAGNGIESAMITCFTVTIPNQPGTPNLVRSTDSSIEIKWAPAYDDGGSPIKEYQVEMDEVEGIGFANIVEWENVFTGAALTTVIDAGLQPKLQYRFRVRAVSEYLKESIYSEVATFYAASVP
jgi:hypothetical protein